MLKDVTYLVAAIKFVLWNGEDKVLVLNQIFLNCFFDMRILHVVYLVTELIIIQVTPTCLQALCKIGFLPFS